MRPGAQSVMDSGQPMMPSWPAGSLDSWILVKHLMLKTLFES